MLSSTLGRKKWLGLLCLCLLAPVSALFFIGGPNHSHLASVHYAWNLGHLVFFFSATLALHWLFGFTKPSQQLLYIVLVFFLSLCIEIIQTQFGRFFSVSDIARNLLGASLGLALLPIGRKRWLWAIPVSLLILVDFTRFGQVIWRDIRIAQRLPIIENFEQPTLTRYWRNSLTIVDDITYAGDYAGKVQLKPGTYADIFFAPLPRNWRGFQSLKMAIYWPETEPRTVNIRLHDITHELNAKKPSNDRFNQSVVLTSGWNHLQFDLPTIETAPETRSMDLHQMHSLGIFFTQQQQPGWIIIDELVLEP